VALLASRDLSCAFGRRAGQSVPKDPEPEAGPPCPSGNCDGGLRDLRTALFFNGRVD